MPRSRISDQERRRRVWTKAGGRCAHCGKVTSGRQRTVDHVVPSSMGGGYDRRNLMPLCYTCNQIRGNAVVNPGEYYPYVNESSIEQAIDYQRQWLQSRIGADGTKWL